MRRATPDAWSRPKLFDRLRELLAIENLWKSLIPGRALSPTAGWQRRLRFEV